jgi:predicted PurR-regulated permease PerM
MVGAMRAAIVLLLLSVFFAYVLAPIVELLRSHVRFGRRPLSRAAMLVVVYLVVFGGAALAWKLSAWSPLHWIHVSAPAAIESLFGDRSSALVERFVGSSRAPAAASWVTHAALEHIESEVRSAASDLVSASRYAWWLVVSPIVAFILLTAAPGFRRSAQRLVPHGHLQWRADEYLRDVNSALAGYVRAQLAAGVIIGLICTAAFSFFGLPYAMSMGVAAGALELVPVIGPIATLLMASSQAQELALAVLVFLAALRLTHDYAIYPRLIRRGMHLPALVVIPAIWCGAALAGVTGVILALPIAGFMSVSLRHWREYRDIERLVRDTARARESLVGFAPPIGSEAAVEPPAPSIVDSSEQRAGDTETAGNAFPAPTAG